MISHATNAERIAAAGYFHVEADERKRFTLNSSQYFGEAGTRVTLRDILDVMEDDDEGFVTIAQDELRYHATADDGDWQVIGTRNPAAVALGRLGGSARSEAKTAAVRENGKRGGWPKGRPRKAE